MYFNLSVVLIFFVVVALVVFGTLIVAGIVRRNRPYREKNTVYECGEPTIGSAWVRFNLRFYTTALVFLIFDVEVVFLFPVIVNLKSIGLLAFLEIVFFVGILALGLVYAWAYGALDWVREDNDPQNEEALMQIDHDHDSQSAVATPSGR
jgi:NADH-quinone oxidoreductase subunit A